MIELTLTSLFFLYSLKLDMNRDLKKYLSRRPLYNTLVSMLGGMGIGILITYPFVGPHPVRWGVALLAIAAFAYIYPLSSDR